MNHVDYYFLMNDLLDAVDKKYPALIRSTIKQTKDQYEFICAIAKAIGYQPDIPKDEVKAVTLQKLIDHIRQQRQ